MDSKIKTTVLIIIGLFALSFLISSLFNKGDFGNVAHIKINGVIMSEGGGFWDQGIVSSSDVVDSLKNANEDDSIKAILLEIDSPGGSPVASAEIADAVAKSNKTVVAWIRETGASGAYWVASSAYKIVAHPLSITGSIGVNGAYLQFSGLLERFNVTYERMVAGKYKDLGSPYKQLTDDERDELQGKLDLMHEYFIQSVAENRNMSANAVRKIADGNIYLGMEAKEIGLVDFLGGKEIAEEIIKKRENLTAINYVEYGKKTSLLDIFSQMANGFGFSFGKGFANGVMEKDLPIRT